MPPSPGTARPGPAAVDRPLTRTIGDAANHPSWLRNVAANPEVCLNLGGEDVPMRAAILFLGEEEGGMAEAGRLLPQRRHAAQDRPGHPCRAAEPDPRPWLTTHGVSTCRAFSRTCQRSRS
ncbi:nitroreductase/quinone reductase family protein [Streptomyces sp. NPDC049627]|uniref:nitroreductase/quinone reductase family protein n=1 Tax=Streptomyces sp. NPDC049627 TaxID=3365595 RepID=UPI00379C53DC